MMTFYINKSGPGKLNTYALADYSILLNIHCFPGNDWNYPEISRSWKIPIVAGWPGRCEV